MAFNLEQAPFEINLAEQLDDAVLDSLGIELKEQIEIDESSRKEWMDTNKNWLRLASQVREDKSFPWPNASNVKFPLLTIASMQFHARALPSLVNSSSPIRSRVIGKDPEGLKLQRAERVGKYMSYQILEEMDDWLDEMDRLLFVLPMVGICYKKTFYSESSGKIRSVLILPNDLIINYHATGFERARMTQVVYIDPNEIVELQRAGIFLDIELNESEKSYQDQNRNARDDISNLTPGMSSDMTNYELYETHCWLDIDEDGYKEPYIVTMTKEGSILRIVARWGEEGITYNDKGQVQKIESEDYFTPYIFLPDPSSAVSGLGLGSLLGPTNEAVNTIINQLIDAGTLAVLQSGFLGKGIKLRGGAVRFRPGEWKMVNATGDDLRKQIVPMPVRDPSNVLFQLLGLLIDSGERVSAVSDIMVGENPGQNQPATTTMATLEQGLKVFTGINKRNHRSFTKECKIIYRLNGIYLDEDMYNFVLDEEDGPYTISDFETAEMDIKPASDPNMVSQTQQLVKTEALMQKLAMGMPLSVQEVLKRSLEAEGHEDIDELMTVPQPQPDPEIILKQQEFSHKQQIETFNSKLDALKVQMQAYKDQTGGDLNLAKIDEMSVDVEFKDRQQALAEVQASADALFKGMELNQKNNEQPNKE